MSITVTAVQSGAGSVNGMALTVKVVTGALPAIAQNGATVQDNSSITTAQKSITPHASGSVIYGAVVNGASSANFTPLGNTTFFANVSDAVNGAGYGTLRGTATTTAGTPVTLGASAPASGAGAAVVAFAEILAATTLAEDASSPASVSTTAAKTVTTASFTPPATSLLVAMVSNDYNGTPVNTVSVSDSSGLTWIRLVQDSYTTTSVWIAQVPPFVAATWTGSYAVSTGFVFPFPAARQVQADIANTPGDWLFALVAWRPLPGAATAPSIIVADNAHNWWEPVGAPATDSGAGGAVRTALWAAPAARVGNSLTGVTVIQVATTGPALSLAFTVIDVGGIPPWYQVAAISTNFANAATSLSLSAGAPSAQAILFTAAVTDNNATGVTWPSGWTGLAGAGPGTASVTASNGVDHTADIALWAGYQVTAAGSSSSFTSAGSLDLAGVIAGVLVSAPQPAQPNPNWPVMVTEAAIGSGVQTPPAQMTWTTLGGRSLAMQVTQGKSYSLGQLQAGQGTITLDDPAGTLIPPGTGPYAGIDSGTPLRRRVTWPPSPTPHYVAFNGFFRRWPFSADPQMLRGQVQAEITDAWGYGNGTLNAIAIEECLLDTPNSLWPMTDPAGSLTASNVIPNGTPLSLTVSKYGSGGAAVTWGANSGALPGMSSARVTASGKSGGGSGMFSQQLAGTSLSTGGYGYALTCTGQAFPSVTGGVTIDTIAQPQLGATQAFTAGTSGLFGVANSLPAGQAVVLGNTGGTFPTGVSVATIYFVLGGGTSFSLSLTPGGSPVAISVAGTGSMTPTVNWNPVILAARGLKGTVAQLEVNKLNGNLVLRYRPASATADTLVTIDTTFNYRHVGLAGYSLAFNQNTWRVLVNGGGSVTASGTFSSPLPATFTTPCFGGIMDRQGQGLAFTGTLALAGVYPGISPPIRVLSRWLAAFNALAAEAACDRIERICEYAGLAGRRWSGKQSVTYEGDLCASGQDIGGQAAVSSMNNIAASTLPAMLSVAPTGDIFYLSKLHAWNQPVRWTLGDNTAGGEIPFTIGSIATDYDPTRVTADVQVTQLDTQTVTVPSGIMSATTMAAVAATAGRQYGGQPYQATGYLNADWSSAYNAGGSLQDVANWVQAVYAKPANRIQTVTVDAARHPTAWPFWGGAAAGDMVAVNVRLPTAAAAPLIALTARITQTARSSQFSQDGTAATIAVTLDFAPEYRALICDDATRGKLDGSNVMPW